MASLSSVSEATASDNATVLPLAQPTAGAGLSAQGRELLSHVVADVLLRRAAERQYQVAPSLPSVDALVDMHSGRVVAVSDRLRADDPAPLAQLLSGRREGPAGEALAYVALIEPDLATARGLPRGAVVAVGVGVYHPKTPGAACAYWKEQGVHVAEQLDVALGARIVNEEMRATFYRATTGKRYFTRVLYTDLHRVLLPADRWHADTTFCHYLERLLAQCNVVGVQSEDDAVFLREHVLSPGTAAPRAMVNVDTPWALDAVHVILLQCTGGEESELIVWHASGDAADDSTDAPFNMRDLYGRRYLATGASMHGHAMVATYRTVRAPIPTGNRHLAHDAGAEYDSDHSDHTIGPTTGSKHLTVFRGTGDMPIHSARDDSGPPSPRPKLFAAMVLDHMATIRREAMDDLMKRAKQDMDMATAALPGAPPEERLAYVAAAIRARIQAAFAPVPVPRDVDVKRPTPELRSVDTATEQAHLRVADDVAAPDEADSDDDDPATAPPGKPLSAAQLKSIHREAADNFRRRIDDARERPLRPDEIPPPRDAVLNALLEQYNPRGASVERLEPFQLIADDYKRAEWYDATGNPLFELMLSRETDAVLRLALAHARREARRDATLHRVLAHITGTAPPGERLTPDEEEIRVRLTRHPPQTNEGGELRRPTAEQWLEHIFGTQ